MYYLLYVFLSLKHYEFFEDIPYQLFYNPLQYLRRISTRHDVIWYILCDNCTRSDYNIIADFYPWVNNSSPANPDIMTDYDWNSVFRSRYSCMCMERVSRSINMNSWCNKTVIPYSNLMNVKKHTIKISKEIFSNVYVVAIITTKCRLYVNMFPSRTKQFF